MGPIRGVLHAAMVVDDAHLGDLTATRFAHAIRPKLDGALALDRLTAADDLQIFVLFSSVTTVIGTPGQANYVAANAALEALATRRHAEGKPALAVQWGPIADAGYLTRETRVGDMLEKVLGAAPLAARDALAALPSLLAAGRPVAGISDAAWGDLRQRLPGLASPFWADVPQGRGRNSGGIALSAQIAGLSDEAALPLVLEMLVGEVGAILKLDPKAIDINRPVQEFGVDSLMAVELRTALEVRLGVGLPLLALSDATSLRAMAVKLLQALRGGGNSGTDDIASVVARHEVAAE
jgi:acyl carrier protein